MDSWQPATGGAHFFKPPNNHIKFNWN